MELFPKAVSLPPYSHRVNLRRSLVFPSLEYLFKKKKSHQRPEKTRGKLAHESRETFTVKKESERERKKLYRSFPGAKGRLSRHRDATIK